MRHEVAARWVLPGPLAVAGKELKRYACALHERIVLAARPVRTNLLHICHAGRICQVTSKKSIHHETVETDAEASRVGMLASRV